MEKNGSVGKQLEHFNRIFGSLVGGPERIDLIFEFSVDALEFPVVVVLEKRESVAGEELLHLVRKLGCLLDGVEILEVIGPVSADDRLESESVGQLHALTEIVSSRPRGVGGIDLHSEVFDDFLQFGRSQIPESGGLDAFVSDFRDFLQDCDKIIFCIVPQRIKLN